MILELHDVCKSYYRGKNPVRVLNNVSLQVEQGEYIAIMGPSGSGKTTLMNLMGCLDVPTSGKYILDGQDIGKLDDNRLAEIRNRYVGFVFQDFRLLPRMTALDNVALPLLYAGVNLHERKERARKALTAVGLADRMRFLPSQLSGGQCQRVAIARAMVTKPRILLADEPTGALDTAAGEQIMDLFQKFADEGMTIITITHDPEVAARAHKTYLIRDGQLTGAPETPRRSTASPSSEPEPHILPAEEPDTPPIKESAPPIKESAPEDAIIFPEVGESRMDALTRQFFAHEGEGGQHEA